MAHDPNEEVIQYASRPFSSVVRFPKQVEQKVMATVETTR